MFVACTPKGIIELLVRSGVQLEGKRAVVVGRSNIVVCAWFCLSYLECVDSMKLLV
jgi:hypothetical protein